MPIAEEITKVMITEKRLIDAGKKALIPNTINPDKKSPKVPPKIDRITDSAKNCFKISFSVAPTARLIPTSLVLSVTVAYIIFIMPIPPTSKEIEPIATNTPLTMLNI